MNVDRLIRAWKDVAFRERLSSEEQELLETPVGTPDTSLVLSDELLREIQGGAYHAPKSLADSIIIAAC